MKKKSQELRSKRPNPITYLDLQWVRSKYLYFVIPLKNFKGGSEKKEIPTKSVGTNKHLRFDTHII